MKPFDNVKYHWKNNIDYRAHPEEYRVGKGEQGVLLCEPYKSEILPFWKFKTPAIARESSKKIYQLFIDYIERDDFIGADMARKYLQMGFTRARRYANYAGGKKYKSENETYTKGSGDPEKIKSAEIFFKVWKRSEKNSKYSKLKKLWKEQLG